MLDIFTEFATDPALENNGAWFNIGKGTRVLVARSQNRSYGKSISKEVEAEKELLDKEDDIAEAKSDEILARVMARTILLGWEKFGFKGVELPYTVENAEMVLKVKDFRALIMGLAGKIDGYRVKQEVDQGNA